MRYYIGDVSRILGLTPGALHYFERESVIETPKEENGRRYYSTEDIVRLMSYKKYRSMGVPLKQIARQFSREGDPLGTIADRLARRRQEAQRMAAHYQALSEDIDAFERAVRSIAGQLGRYNVRSSPEVLLLQHEPDGLMTHDKREQERTQLWLEHMPATRLAVTLCEDGREARFGYALLEARAQALSIAEETPVVRRLPERIALHTIVRCDDLYDRPMQAFEDALAYMAAHGLARTGTAWGYIVVVDCSHGIRETYVELWAPFE